MKTITKQRKYEIKQRMGSGKSVVLSLFDGMGYAYSSIHELIGNGFGIGSIKYILKYILN